MIKVYILPDYSYWSDEDDINYVEYMMHMYSDYKTVFMNIDDFLMFEMNPIQYCKDHKIEI